MSEPGREALRRVLELGSRDIENLRHIMPLMERFEAEITSSVFGALQKVHGNELGGFEQIEASRQAHSIWFAGLLDPNLAEERWKLGLALLRQNIPPLVLEALIELLRLKVLEVLARENPIAITLASKYASFLKVLAFDVYRLRAVQASTPRESEGSAKPAGQPATQILIVEDEPAILNALVRGVGRLQGVSVLQANGFKEALQLLQKQQPRVLVLDFDLPDGRGVDLLPFLERQHGAAKVIFVTGHAKHVRSLLQTHPEIVVLEKPVPLDVLRTTIREFL